MTGKQRTLTHERLKELLHYNASTGVFFWRESRSNVKAGTPAGTLGPNKGLPRWMICVNGTKYLASRLAWLYMTGEHPPEGMTVDHINKDSSDDSWPNLRLLTQADNLKNRNRQANSSTGFNGVTKVERRRGTSYRSYLTVDKKRICLGYWDTAEHAFIFRLVTAWQYGFDRTHGMTPEQIEYYLEEWRYRQTFIQLRA